MKDFIEKYKTNTRFKAAVKLGGYVLFIFILVIFCLSKNNELYDDFSEDSSDVVNTIDVIQIGEQYSIRIKINIDNNIILYEINKKMDEILITKENSLNKDEYIFKNNNYYMNISDNYILSSEKEVYDVVDYNYLNIDTINNFLLKAEKNGNEYILYLNDIILDEDSDKYIVILVTNNKINIDYTDLMKELNIANERCNVNIEIENEEE